MISWNKLTFYGRCLAFIRELPETSNVRILLETSDIKVLFKKIL